MRDKAQYRPSILSISRTPAAEFQFEVTPLESRTDENQHRCDPEPEPLETSDVPRFKTKKFVQAAIGEVFARIMDGIYKQQQALTEQRDHHQQISKTLTKEVG